MTNASEFQCADVESIESSVQSDGFPFAVTCLLIIDFQPFLTETILKNVKYFSNCNLKLINNDNIYNRYSNIVQTFSSIIDISINRSHIKYREK